LASVGTLLPLLASAMAFFIVSISFIFLCSSSFAFFSCSISFLALFFSFFFW
jgi:hypothetical protein